MAVAATSSVERAEKDIDRAMSFFFAPPPARNSDRGSDSGGSGGGGAVKPRVLWSALVESCVGVGSSDGSGGAPATLAAAAAATAAAGSTVVPTMPAAVPLPANVLVCGQSGLRDAGDRRAAAASRPAIHMEEAMAKAKAIFHRICPDAEFLPKPVKNGEFGDVGDGGGGDDGEMDELDGVDEFDGLCDIPDVDVGGDGGGDGGEDGGEDGGIGDV